MMRGLVGLFFVVGILTAGLLMLPQSSANGGSDLSERWINANHVQVEVGGRWQDVQMVPLADHLCLSDDPIYSRYCD